MINKNYIQQRYECKRQYYRIRLGVLQCVQKPALVLLLLLILVGAVFMWYFKGKVINLVNYPNLLLPFINIALLLLTIMLPILLIVFILHCIGDFTARADEANLVGAFSKNDLKNGIPILINKKFNKQNNTTTREYYSTIPMLIWEEKAEAIADMFNIHYKEPFQYGGKQNNNSRRIIMITGKGRKMPSRGDLYDEK